MLLARLVTVIADHKCNLPVSVVGRYQTLVVPILLFVGGLGGNKVMQANTMLLLPAGLSKKLTNEANGWQCPMARFGIQRTLEGPADSRTPLYLGCIAGRNNKRRLPSRYSPPMTTKAGVGLGACCLIYPCSILFQYVVKVKSLDESYDE